MLTQIITLALIATASLTAQKHTLGYTWALEECNGTKATREVVCKIAVSSQRTHPSVFDTYRNHRVTLDMGKGTPVPSSDNWIERSRGEAELKIKSRPAEGFYYFVRFNNVPLRTRGRIVFPRNAFEASICWE